MTASTASPPSDAERIPCLDGIRATAALLVMFFHFTGNHGASPWIARTAVLGQTGVDLFFVLSGFLITRILIESRESPRYFRTFYARRTLRIFPLYYGFLALYFFALPALTNQPVSPFAAQSWSWFYLQNIPATFPHWDSSGPSHFWSLAVEEHFYLVWPVIVWACPPRHLRLVLAATLILPAVLRALLVREGIGVFYFTPTRIDSLGYGALLAVLLHHGTWVARHPRFFRWLALAIGPALLAAFVLFSGRNYSVMHLKLSLIPAFYFALIGFCLTDPAARPLTRLLSLRPLRWLGGISYGLYVFHPLCYSLLGDFNAASSLAVALGGSFALTVVVAALSYRYFEAPILGLKRHFRYESRPATP